MSKSLDNWANRHSVGQWCSTCAEQTLPPPTHEPKSEQRKPVGFVQLIQKTQSPSVNICIQ
ncbi:hypothetical protein BCR44DRAFT_38593 [Catenaria anguillulae PL171]|uniref:Uncharacterized protein n=1 Tax=Catenaria anguillulae PL171 TaxID=765915 RepID=A0A1Y2HP04_9FUNG|nr:hypothetical protein BCR44DRAFT_38593 [Catenaria anguillulae PL171]